MEKYLIVVDMQNDFVYDALGSEAAQGIIGKIKEKLDAFKGKVIFTRDTHTEDYLNTREGKRLPVKHCIKGSKGWEIVPELKPYADICYDKDTFGSIQLAEDIARAQDAESIELVGVCTSICVISNALLLKAYMPETDITVDGSCCACVSEESHEAALKAMETAQIDIVR